VVLEEGVVAKERKWCGCKGKEEGLGGRCKLMWSGGSGEKDEDEGERERERGRM
jgi:hypothetical protein